MTKPFRGFEMTLSRNLRQTMARGLSLAALMACAWASTADALTLKPYRAEAVRRSIGVNTHINYTDGAYANAPFVIDALKYIGVDRIRESIPVTWIHGTAPLSTYDKMMAQGIYFSCGNDSILDTAKWVESLEPLVKRNPGKVTSIEGLNEVDRVQNLQYKGKKGVPAGEAFQRDLYTAMKGSRVLKDIPVYDFTGYDLKADGDKQIFAGRADYTNFHAYAQNGGPPRDWLLEPARVRKLYKNPAVITEMGYASMPQSGWLLIGVDEATQAKGILGAIFNSLDLGFERIYLYELVDQKPDPGNSNLEMHFGLFTNKFEKKPAARALHTLTGLLGDKDKKALTFETRAVNFDIKGLPDTGHYLAVESSNGRTFIVLWNEVQFWDRAAGKALPMEQVPISLSLADGAKIVAVTDPINDKSPTRTVGPAASLDLMLPDHPILVEIRR
jgi:hypothetical protein